MLDFIKKAWVGLVIWVMLLILAVYVLPMFVTLSLGDMFFLGGLSWAISDLVDDWRFNKE